MSPARIVSNEPEVTVDEQPFEPIAITLEIETIEQFKDLFHRLNISGDRIEDEYFEDLSYSRSAVNSSNAGEDSLYAVLKQVRRDQNLKLKNR